MISVSLVSHVAMEVFFLRWPVVMPFVALACLLGMSSFGKAEVPIFVALFLVCDSVIDHANLKGDLIYTMTPVAAGAYVSLAYMVGCALRWSTWTYRYVAAARKRRGFPIHRHFSQSIAYSAVHGRVAAM